MTNSKKNKPLIILIAGIVLIISAAVILISEMCGRKKSVGQNVETVEFIESILPEKSTGIKEETADSNMPAVNYNGKDYVAVLEYERFSVKLPVAGKWGRINASRVPCLFTGNPYDGTTVIGAADRKNLFDFVLNADIGDNITLTDMNGNVFRYRISNVKHASDSKKETLTDERYELCLFAKSRQTGEYIIICCTGGVK